MKISFTGTGCSGKSTLLKLCQDHYGDQFEYVTEVTRPIARSGLKINEQGGDATQRAIIEAHIQNNKLSNAIMDRCIVDGYIYTTWLYSNNKVTQQVYDYAWDTLGEIINDIDIIFYTAPVEMKDDGERSTNKRFQTDIHEMIGELLKGDPWHKVYTGNLIYLEGSVEERFKAIKDTITTCTMHIT